MNNILYLILSLLLLIANESLAQKKIKGQLITTNGDTTEVYLLTDHNSSNKDILRYKETARSTIVNEVAPEDAVSFSSDILYLKVMDDVINRDRKVFYKVLLIGEVSLYSTINEQGDLTFYYLKKDEELKEIPKDTFVEFLNENFRNCQAVEIKQDPYYEAYYLKNVIASYNACINPEKYVYFKTRRMHDVYVGLGAGTGLMFFSLDEVPFINLRHTTLDFTLSALGNVELSRDLSLQLELLYSKRGIDARSGKFSGDYILVPVIAQFNIFPNDFKKGELGNFYFNMGYVFGDLINFSYDTNGPEWDVLYARYAKISFDYTSGYLLGVGAFFKTHKNLLKFEVRYCDITSWSNYIGFETLNGPSFRNLAFKTHSINLNVSYILK